MAKAKHLGLDAPNADQPSATAEWIRPPGTAEAALPGIVVRAYGKFFDVRLRGETRTLLSTVRGNLRRQRLRTDLIAVGDRVWVTDVGEGEGQIEAVEPRVRSLARLARKTRDTEQVLLANPDQALFLFALANPQPHLRTLDRLLVLAESRDLPVLIGFNKSDLLEGEPSSVFATYESIYPVMYLSVKKGAGIEALRDRLRGKVTVVAGPSGVGKSSLLNALDPDRSRNVGEISLATGKGRHTTTGTELFDLGDETFVADTAGIRSILFQGVDPAKLPEYFPEFRPFLGECRYRDCDHLDEEECAVREALKEGKISAARYESYASLRRNDDTDTPFDQ